MKMLRIFLFITVIVGLSGRYSQIMAQSGQSAVQFLTIEPDARVSSIGGAGVTILDGGFGGYYNPASLGWQQGKSAGLSYFNWLPGITNDVRYNRFAGTYQMGAKSSLALSMTYLNLGEQMATDESNAELGTFSNQQMSTGLSYGREVSRRLALGAGIKYIYSSIGSGQTVIGQAIDPAWSIAADIGALWRSGKMNIVGQSGEIRVGSSLSHVGSGLAYLGGNSSVAPLPQTFRTGVALQREIGASGDHQLTLSLDSSRLLARMNREVTGNDTTWTGAGALGSLVKGWGPIKRFDGMKTVELGFFDQFTIGLGAEYWFRNLFALRSGYYSEHPDNGDRRFMTMGTGIRYLSTEFDVSYLKTVESDHPLDGTLRVSLRIHFDGGYKKPKIVKNRSVAQKSVPGGTYRPVTSDGVANENQQQTTEYPDSLSVVDVPTEIVADLEPVENDSLENIPGQKDMEDETGVELNTGVSGELVPADVDSAIKHSFASINVDLLGFPTMSSELTPGQKDAIARAVILLQKNPDVTVHIEGHTDDRGPRALNEMLSEARARAIYLEMLRYGVFDWSRLTIEGFGARQLLQAEKTAAARRANRRGELSLPAADSDNVWIVEDSSDVLIELTSGDNLPVNDGGEFEFTWLELTRSKQAQQWLHSVAGHLANHPEQSVKIAHVVRYSEGSESFKRELEKARGELLKDLLIRIGVDHSRVEVLSDKDPFWEEHVLKVTMANNKVMTWLYITK